MRISVNLWPLNPGRCSSAILSALLWLASLPPKVIPFLSPTHVGHLVLIFRKDLFGELVVTFPYIPYWLHCNVSAWQGENGYSISHVRELVYLPAYVIHLWAATCTGLIYCCLMLPPASLRQIWLKRFLWLLVLCSPLSVNQITTDQELIEAIPKMIVPGLLQDQQIKQYNWSWNFSARLERHQSLEKLLFLDYNFQTLDVAWKS